MYMYMYVHVTVVPFQGHISGVVNIISKQLHCTVQVNFWLLLSKISPVAIEQESDVTFPWQHKKKAADSTIHLFRY